jgi:hypothetical protein
VGQRVELTLVLRIKSTNRQFGICLDIVKNMQNSRPMGVDPAAIFIAGELFGGGLKMVYFRASVLQSVSMTLDRMNGRRGEIGDLEAYLLGSLYHRLNRALKKEQRREETIRLVSSIEELEVLGAANQAEQQDIEGTLHAQEILDRMDAWSRKVWVAREYGYRVASSPALLIPLKVVDPFRMMFIMARNDNVVTDYLAVSFVSQPVRAAQRGGQTQYS